MQHYRGKLEYAHPLHPGNATLGICIQQGQLCPVHVSLLVRNGVVAADRPNALLVDGQFAVQRSANSALAQVPVDQTIEQTMNRDSKTKGGIVGISLNRGAVQRWILTAHDRAKKNSSSGSRSIHF